MLYKYVSPERIDVLTGRRIRFTPYIQLNDPFECRFTVNPPPGEEDEAVEDDYNAEWAEVEVWLENRIGQLGMLCLSRTPRNILMWSHYTMDHRGLVLGFDESHPFFQQQAYYYEGRVKRELPFAGFGTLRDVVYTQERPNIDFGSRIPFEAFFTKSLDWSYEQEVRIFRHLEEAEVSKGEHRSGIHLFELPSGVIRKVILGAQATKELHEQAISVAKSDKHQLIEVEKAKIDRRGYTVQFEPLLST